MDRRTQAIIGAVIIALGIGVYSLGLIEQESNVRYVADLHRSPAEHTDGDFVLLGIPQAAAHPDTGEPNPLFWSTTERVVATGEGTESGLIRYRLTPDQDPARTDSHVRWTLDTLIQDRAGNVLEQTNATWILDGDWTLFQVDDFETGEKTWAIYNGPLREGVRPQPSQLTGRLMSDVPTGALIYEVEPDGYTVGCSSKFLPDDVVDKYDPDGDGVADGT